MIAFSEFSGSYLHDGFMKGMRFPEAQIDMIHLGVVLRTTLGNLNPMSRATYRSEGHPFHLSEAEYCQ
jgi:hypothetical protein